MKTIICILTVVLCAILTNGHSNISDNNIPDSWQMYCLKYNVDSLNPSSEQDIYNAQMELFYH